MKTDPAKTLDWKWRSAKKAQEKKRARMKDNWANRAGTLKGNQNTVNQVSEKRKKENKTYSVKGKAFLLKHPICPVTGEKTTEIHHTMHREGAWLNLVRYWVAVSRRGHRYIEDHKSWARQNNLLLSGNALYDAHCEKLVEMGESLEEPVFYTFWDSKPLLSLTKST